jgi:hypothetical protein
MEPLTHSRWNYRDFISFKLDFGLLLLLIKPVRPSQNWKTGVKDLGRLRAVNLLGQRSVFGSTWLSRLPGAVTRFVQRTEGFAMSNNLRTAAVFAIAAFAAAWSTALPLRLGTISSGTLGLWREPQSDTDWQTFNQHVKSGTAILESRAGGFGDRAIDPLGLSKRTMLISAPAGGDDAEASHLRDKSKFLPKRCVCVESSRGDHDEGAGTKIDMSTSTVVAARITPAIRVGLQTTSTTTGGWKKSGDGGTTITNGTSGSHGDTHVGVGVSISTK